MRKMAFLHRGLTVGELITKLTEYERDMYVVVLGFDHSFDYHLDVNLEPAIYENGQLSSAAGFEGDSFNVVVIS